MGFSSATKSAIATNKLSALRLNQIRNFSTITIDNSTAVSNQKFGIGVIGYYGTIVIKNTQCNENETDGMVFAKSSGYSNKLYQNDAQVDDAQYLDCSERSYKPGMQHSRSPTVLHQTDNAMFDQKLNSYRQEVDGSLYQTSPQYS